MVTVDRFDLAGARLWLTGVASAIAALVVGSIAFPNAVYDNFLWQYFWGPVQADAQSAYCAAREAGSPVFLYSQSECAAATGPVAYPGYTVVSEIGYAVTLVVGLSGVVLLLRQLDIARTKRFFYAMVPFFFLGGTLRVVEDIDNATPDSTVLPYPWDALLISPIIYFTMFFLVLGIVIGGVWLARKHLDVAYERLILYAGGGVLFANLAYFGWMAVTDGNPVVFRPQVIGIVLAVAAVTAVATYYAAEEFAPVINSGTGRAGLVVLFAHTLDGAANVVGLDYMRALGAGPNLVPKHPVNEFVVNSAGAAWPFLLLKIAAALFVLYVMDDLLFEESPRYAILLLIAVTAVGMGPGTRDVMRATIGV